MVTDVTDQEIMDAKAIVGRAGIGCEPASAASVAGLKKFVESGIIGKGERAVCIVTGHQLKSADATVGYHSLHGEELSKAFGNFNISKNPYANPPVQVKNDLEEILRALA